MGGLGLRFAPGLFFSHWVAQHSSWASLARGLHPGPYDGGQTTPRMKGGESLIQGHLCATCM